MSNAFSYVLRACILGVAVCTLLVACEKSSVSPEDAATTSSARLSSDTTTTAKTDSTCKKPRQDSLVHKHPGHVPGDSAHHHPPADSLRPHPPMDSVRHD